MSSLQRLETPDEVIGRVLRRVEVSKMARKLQDRLALANYKAMNGMDNLSFNILEQQLGDHLQKKKKRQGSSVASSSDSSSSSVSENHYVSRHLDSPPLSAPTFSSDIYGPDTVSGSRKRTRFAPAFVESSPTPSKRTLRRTQTMGPPSTTPFDTRATAWKSTPQLLDSSPLQPGLQPEYRTSHGPNISFVSRSSTIPDSPTFSPQSDDDDLPTHSFHQQHKLHGSPPRTPPPTRSRAIRNRKLNTAGQEGADLLLYLATSPSPANPGMKPPRSTAAQFPPSTPPSSHAALPSTMMATPGGTNIFSGYSTPGQQFNFSDFVNVTPSPAQGAFGGSRTPAITKTPLAAREARRRLNYDGMVPPGGDSPRVTTEKGRGLGMELGGELIS
ncbi:hypothetical protein MMC25_005828 [Agyrium rufum]|nr:hypothetical protein [Agyrium rufum]